MYVYSINGSRSYLSLDCKGGIVIVMTLVRRDITLNCMCVAGSSGYSPVLSQRQLGKGSGPGPTPSPDSAVYSCYSPTASPVTSRHTLPSSSSGLSSPFTPSLSRNNSDASQYGGSQHSSCYSQRWVCELDYILDFLSQDILYFPNL